MLCYDGSKFLFSSIRRRRAHKGIFWRRAERRKERDTPTTTLARLLSSVPSNSRRRLRYLFDTMTALDRGDSASLGPILKNMNWAPIMHSRPQEDINRPWAHVTALRCITNLKYDFQRLDSYGTKAGCSHRRPSLPHQSELRGKQPSDDTARKESAGTASAKLKLEALSS